LNGDDNVDNVIDGNLKDMRKQSEARVEGPKRDTGKENRKDDAPKTDQERYPHHNSSKDIEEARKRYLQRKIARERARMA